MNMKILGLALILSAPVMADNAGEAFATGFANAMNRYLGGREYQAPSYNQPQVNVDIDNRSAPHYDAVNAWGTYGGYYFFNQGECQRFLGRSDGKFVDCVMVQ